MSSAAASQFKIKPFVSDYRKIDSEACEVAHIGQFREWIVGLCLERQVTDVLVEIIEIAEKYREHAWGVLTSPPLTINQRVDLRTLEGAGFYQKVEDRWLYHKGGGSIEALALSERYPPKEKAFAAFGVTYTWNIRIARDFSLLRNKTII